MKKILTIALIFTAAICMADPKLEFDTQIHNFGTVKQNVAVTHIFSFTNKGKDPLQIIRISPS